MYFRGERERGGVEGGGGGGGSHTKSSLFHLVYLCMSLGLSMNVVFKVYFFDCKGVFFVFCLCCWFFFFFGGSILHCMSLIPFALRIVIFFTLTVCSL